MRLLAAALLALGVAGAGPGALAAAADQRGAEQRDLELRLDDPRITESSALVQSTVDPALAYTVNDSGDGPVVYVVALADGEVVGTATLADTEVADVEALAIGPDDRLYVADVGDNLAERTDTALYALDQPGRGDSVVAARRYPLRHAGGPRDVEAVVLGADGSAYLLEKGILGGEVTRVARLRTGRTNLARPVADTTVPGLVTDADVLPDRRHAVLRTYGGAYVVTMPGFEVLGSVAVPPLPQGESLAVLDGGPDLLVGTEGAESPVLRVSVSDEVWAATRAGSGGDGAATVRPEPRTASGQPVADPGFPWWIAVVGVTVAAVVGLFLGPRRRR